MPAGRPSKYRDDMPAEIIEHGRAGLSRAEIAVALGVHRQTLNRWSNDLPELCDALERADDLSQAFWESYLRSAVIGKAPDVNPRLLEMYMRNRFSDWNAAKKQETTIETTLTIDHVDAVRKRIGQLSRRAEPVDITPINKEPGALSVLPMKKTRK